MSILSMSLYGFKAYVVTTRSIYTMSDDLTTLQHVIAMMIEEGERKRQMKKTNYQIATAQEAVTTAASAKPTSCPDSKQNLTMECYIRMLLSHEPKECRHQLSWLYQDK